MRKITTLLMLCLVCIGLNAQTSTTKMEVPVKDLSQLSNSAKYFLRSERCFLLYSETVGQKIATSNAKLLLSTPAKNLEDNNQLFEIRNEGGKYYLYSVGAGKYVTSNGSFSDTADGDLTLTRSSNATYTWKLCIGGNGLNSQIPGQMDEGIVVNWWTSEDEGNRYQIVTAEETLAHTGWTVTAFNESATSGNEGGVSFLQDVDGETFYHSDWGSNYADGTPGKLKGQDGVQGFMIELPASCSISEMTYAGRSNDGNNWATQVRVYVYETLPDGITTNLSGYTFTDKEAKFGTGNTVLGTPAFENSSSPWAENRAPKTIEFATPVTGKYVLFLADATTYSNGYFTCSYLNITGEYNEAIEEPDPVVTEGEYYTFQCLSESGHYETRYICDNGTVINGQSSSPSTFSFEAAADGKFYMKSNISGKYLNYNTGNNTIYASADKVTAWKISRPDHTPTAVALECAENVYLNNVGTASDGTVEYLQPKNHAGGVGASNHCSMWTMKVAVSETTMGTALTLAEQALAATGVGYPTADCAERAPLTEAVANANTDKTSKEYFDALAAALTAFANTSTINLPENGKAYTFTNVQKDGTKFYFACDPTTGVYMSDNEAEACTYVCKVVGDKYVFVNNNGQYFAVKGSSAGTNGNKGYTEAYDQTEGKFFNDFTITKLTPSNVATGGNTDAIEVNAQLLFGYVGLATQRADRNELIYFVIKNDKGFDQANAPFCRHNLTSMVKITEATYPNKPVMKAANGVTNGEEAIAAVATYCAPFATVLPAGVNAYYATSDEGHYVKLTLLDGAIPANTGVLLTATDDALVDQTVVMVPAAAEVQGTADGNLFAADAAKGEYTVGAEVNAYVVGKSGETVGFYPLSATNRTIAQSKAYLVLDQALSAVKFYFGGDDVTGIEAVEKAESNNAPIFDLSGRRVVKAAKGGIYIQNGKKFIVK